MTPKIIVIIGVTMFLSAILGVVFALLKNRDADAWGFACFLFPPLVIILIMLPKARRPRRKPLTVRDFDEEARDDLFLD